MRHRIWQKMQLFLAILVIAITLPLMGIMQGLPNLGGLVSRLTGAVGAQPAGGKDPTKFKSVIAHIQWWQTALETASGVIACKAGKWNRIGEFTVPAQQLYHFGYGDEGHPENQGYIFIGIYDDTATNSVVEEGFVRLVQVNARETVGPTVWEGRTENLRGDTADKRKMIALPEKDEFFWVGEDSKLVIEFKPDADDTIVKAAIGTALGLDVWNVPVTIKQ